MEENSLEENSLEENILMEEDSLEEKHLEYVGHMRDIDDIIENGTTKELISLMGVIESKKKKIESKKRKVEKQLKSSTSSKSIGGSSSSISSSISSSSSTLGTLPLHENENIHLGVITKKVKNELTILKSIIKSAREENIIQSNSQVPSTGKSFTLIGEINNPVSLCEITTISRHYLFNKIESTENLKQLIPSGIYQRFVLAIHLNSRMFRLLRNADIIVNAILPYLDEKNLKYEDLQESVILHDVYIEPLWERGYLIITPIFSGITNIKVK